MAEKVSVVLLAIPVLGLLCRGIYWFPAIYLTKGRDPWLTIILALGLLVTVVALLAGLSFGWCVLAAGCACLLLLIRRFFGKLDHNVERFGFVHATTLLGMFWLAYFVR